jgi:hypothetical protein
MIGKGPWSVPESKKVALQSWPSVNLILYKSLQARLDLITTCHPP